MMIRFYLTDFSKTGIILWLNLPQFDYQLVSILKDHVPPVV